MIFAPGDGVRASEDEADVLIGFYADEIPTTPPGGPGSPDTINVDTVFSIFNAEGCSNPVSVSPFGTDNVRFDWWNENEVSLGQTSEEFTECDVRLIDPELHVLSAPSYTGLGLFIASNVDEDDISGVQIIGTENPNSKGISTVPNLLASTTSSNLSVANLQSDVLNSNGDDGSFPFMIHTEDGNKVTLDSPWESFGILANVGTYPVTVDLEVYQRGERFLGDSHPVLTAKDIFIFTVDETLGKTLVAPFLFGTTDVVAVDLECFQCDDPPSGPGPGTISRGGIVGWAFNVNGSGQMMQYSMAQDSDDEFSVEDNEQSILGFDR